jgi:hypothetical protein
MTSQLPSPMLLVIRPIVLVVFPFASFRRPGPGRGRGWVCRLITNASPNLAELKAGPEIGGSAKQMKSFAGHVEFAANAPDLRRLLLLVKVVVGNGPGDALGHRLGAPNPAGKKLRQYA